jgi:catalase (peroxidase I)
LSWGDLIVFAGTAAILDMGGPVTELCAGRVDNGDGKLSEPLGPGPEAPPCPVQGNCQPPLGTSTIGLIYVNPEGFMGEPDPDKSVNQVREVFSRMDFDDRETVALIGGGHAFGKAHGACPAGAGPPPKDDPYNPWPGLCGTGKGKDTWTSGIEGPWTSNPGRWDNQFFQLLLTQEYELHKGPGDAWQWRIKDSNSPLMMMTTDLSLVRDEQFKALVTEFANDQSALDEAFSHAWYKLTHSGGEWAPNKKCVPFSKLGLTNSTVAMN